MLGSLLLAGAVLASTAGAAALQEPGAGAPPVRASEPEPAAAPGTGAAPAPLLALGPEHDRERDALWTFDVGGRWRLDVGPRDSRYAPYVADPLRPTTSLTLTSGDSGIDDAGGARYGFRLGARLELLRLWHENRPEGGVQLDADVGMIAQFDRDSSSDNLGWDGLFAFHLSWLATDELALRVGVAHDSSHLGDEFVESTGRTRIEYTREEYRFGASWRLAEPWRLYGEYGWGYDLGNRTLMEEGRVQGGLEWEGAPGRRATPYAALDLSGFEEDDWEANATLQAGFAFAVPSTGGRWRIGLEAYDGRSIIGELFQAEESWVAFGIWFDP